MPLQIQRSEGTGAIMTRLDRSERQRITIARAAEGLADPPLDRMIQRGHRVICIDNFFTGDIANIRPLMNHPVFSFIEHDVTRPIRIPGAIDRIYNLACPASPRHYQRDPIGTMKTCVARIFNTYGPRMPENDGRVVSSFVVQALRNEPITIYGDGSQTRSFCFVDDLLAGLELLMESADEVTGPCNLGNPQEVSVRDVAAQVVVHTGSQSRLVMRPLPQDDPRRRPPVIFRALKLLGWRPRVSLEDGLKATIGYFSLKVFDTSAIAATAQLSNRHPA